MLESHLSVCYSINSINVLRHDLSMQSAIVLEHVAIYWIETLVHIFLSIF